MSDKIGILRMQPSRRWAICRPRHDPVEITAGEFFRIEIGAAWSTPTTGPGYYAVGGPELRSGMRAAIGSGE